MKLEQAKKEAREIAEKDNVAMVVVHAPIEEAENEEGPYGYCTLAAKNLLYKYGEIVEKY